MKVAIINLNSGNLLSVISALEAIGHQATVIDQPNSDFDALIMPGQGRFSFVASQLDCFGWRKFIHSWVNDNKIFIGICVGMQLLFERSDEDSHANGLGILKGTISQLNHLKTPMVGWAKLVSDNPLLKDQYFYFVNSYAIAHSDCCIASVNYGDNFCAAVQQGNLYGFQFHPEKSGIYGQELLKQCLK